MANKKKLSPVVSLMDAYGSVLVTLVNGEGIVGQQGIARYIEVEGRRLGRAGELTDFPRPDLILQNACLAPGQLVKIDEKELDTLLLRLKENADLFEAGVPARPAPLVVGVPTGGKKKPGGHAPRSKASNPYGGKVRAASGPSPSEIAEFSVGSQFRSSKGQTPEQRGMSESVDVPIPPTPTPKARAVRVDDPFDKPYYLVRATRGKTVRWLTGVPTPSWTKKCEETWEYRETAERMLAEAPKPKGYAIHIIKARLSMQFEEEVKLWP